MMRRSSQVGLGRLALFAGAVFVVLLGLPGGGARGTASTSNVTVFVAVLGGAGGTAEVGFPDGKTSACRTTCNFAVSSGTSVVLTAVPDDGWGFGDWSSVCQQEKPNPVCLFTVNGGTKVAVNFNPAVQVTTVGAGSVDGEGIQCGTTCVASYPTGTTVSLKAAPSPGAAFLGWKGACTGTSTCDLTIDGPQSIVAKFSAPKGPVADIVVQTAGSPGTVTSSPGEISCGTVCSGSYAEGTDVALTATPAPGSYFVGWSGACTGSGPVCPATAGSSDPATATFGPASLKPVYRQVAASVSGAGSIGSNPAGIDCGNTCIAGFAAGTIVSFQAQPSLGWVFKGWGGDCTGPGACKVDAGDGTQVAATFVKASMLIIRRSGSGTVIATVPSAGISCTAPCTRAVATGATARLSAFPAPGSRFAGWSGACTGAAPRCNIALDQDANAAARFSSGSARSAQLTLTTSSGGVVQSSPTGINCGSVCQTAIPAGGLSLTAMPASGFEFAGWNGACSGTAPSCLVSAAGAATATFRRIYQFIADTQGAGGVSLAVVGGLHAARALQAAQGSVPVTSDQSVTVTATPDQGSHFDHWSGTCSGNAPVCVTSSANAPSRTLASFATGAPSNYAFPLMVTRQGAGLVSSAPQGISCGASTTCSFAWPANQKVDLTATGTGDTTFKGWTNIAGCAGRGLCEVEVPPPDAVVATFMKTSSTCEHQPKLSGTAVVAVLRHPRRLHVRLQLSSAATAELLLSRPGLTLFDSHYQLRKGRHVITRAPFDLAVAAGRYVLHVVLTNRCFSPPALAKVVQMPKVG
jgi:hypothetical protein